MLDDAPLRNRYALEGKIGRGGMGLVAEASDRRIGRRVAIKRLTGTPTPELVERFVREARIQAGLDHPAILPVYDLGIQSDGRPWFAMRKVSGMTLADVLHLQGQGDDGALAEWPRPRLLSAFVDVCLAIEHAHSRRVVHRDLKPANVMLGDDGGVYVLDWGVAATTGEPGDPGAGTVGYMAPEQGEHGACDPRADVFALGRILAELAPEGALEAACARATADDPRKRTASARELAESVLRHLDGDRDGALAAAEIAAHVQRAHAALAEGTLAGRGRAMREAGLALALHPEGAEAGEIAERLLLEPPEELPAAVQAKLDAEDDAVLRTRAWAAAAAYGGLPLFFPLYLIQGVRDWWTMSILPVTTAILIAVALTATRGVLPRSRLWIAAFGNVAVLFVLSRICGPFLVPPGMAVLVAMIVATHPRLRLWWLAAGVLALGAIGGWLLETWGTIAPTVTSDGDRLILDSELIGLPPVPTVIGLVGYVLAILVIGARFGRRISDANHSTRRALAVQAWHLRRMLGGPSSEVE